uniref:Uncharacterized protein n=1 Tax=Cannabis sativa TaxID=3483 RepID=A0A803QB92_CANSA
MNPAMRAPPEHHHESSTGAPPRAPFWPVVTGAGTIMHIREGDREKDRKPRGSRVEGQGSGFNFLGFVLSLEGREWSTSSLTVAA